MGLSINCSTTPKTSVSPNNLARVRAHKPLVQRGSACKPYDDYESGLNYKDSKADRSNKMAAQVTLFAVVDGCVRGGSILHLF